MVASRVANLGASRRTVRRRRIRPMSIPMFDALHVTATIVLAMSTAGLGAFAVLQARRLRALGAALGAEREAREDLARDLAALLECSRELGGRVRDQATRQKSVADRVNRIAQQVDGGAAIDHVERLLADGLGVEQIKRVCELSQGEAALLERWKKHRSAA